MRLFFWQLAAICTIVLWADAALSQRRPIADDTLGEERSIVTPEGNIRGLPGDRITGGARRGGNLFHSFREFGIDPGRAVYFDDPGVQNILGRVTGGNISEIFGRLGVLGNANLFLMNPRGILFGRGASLDVRGAFLASTADSFVFGNGFAFSATNLQAPPLLTVNVPIGLQYGTQTPGEITVNRAGLFVDSGQSLILAGGAIILNNGGLVVREPQGGRIELGAVSGAGTVELEQNGNILRLSVPEGVARADVRIINDSGVGVVAEDGGSIAINARNIDILDESFIQTGIRQRATNSQAGDITLNATGLTQIAGSNLISRNAIGNSGDIRITTGSLLLANGGLLSTSTLRRGDAGDVIIGAQDRIALDDSTVVSVVEDGEGNAGNIEINTNALELRNRAQLRTTTSRRGNAGNVVINAQNQVTFENGSFAISGVNVGDIGNAGNVIINAQNQVTFENSAAITEVSENSEGNAGNIEINTNALEVRNGAQLTAGTRGRGDAGNVIITADEKVVFDGIGVNRLASLASSSVGDVSFAGVAVGNAGDVQIRTGSLQVSNGASLQASTFGEGDAGNIIITADRVVFDRSGAAFSRVEQGGIGRGGNINIDTGSLIVRNGAQLLVNIEGRGDAGNIIITADDQIVFDGNSAALSRVDENGTGRGGNINIETDSLVVRNGAAITASTIGQGGAGNIQIAADTVSLDGVGNDGRSSGLFTFTAPRAQEQGGDITINANSIRLTNGAVINAETGNTFEGGDVAINADTFKVIGGGQVITTTSSSGRAGNITLNVTDRIILFGFDPEYADRLNQFGEAIVSNQGAASGLFANTAASSSGQGGTIRIRTEELDISDRARIVVNSQGSGVAGNIGIRTDSLELTNNARLLADTRGEGDAGNVVINADTFEATNGGQVITTTASNGRAGNIGIRTDSLELTDNARLLAESRGEGNAGNVIIDANTFEATAGGQITTTTAAGSGQAGNITLNVTNRIILSGVERGAASGLFANTSSSGQGGTIRMTTRELDISDRAGIIVNSEGEGVAGDINISAQTVQLDQGRITAETTTVDGGNITLQNLDLLLLRNGSDISATAGTNETSEAEGDGGNINISADFIVAVPRENSDIRANAFTGSGGRVNITSEGLFGIEAREVETNLSDITASSEQGVQGTVNINQPDVDPSRGLVELPVNVVEASDQIAQSCPTDGNIAGEVGEFVVTGRGGLPADPAEILGGETVLTQWAEVDSAAAEEQGSRRNDRPSTSTPPQAELVEAQGWTVGAEGKVILTAESPAVEPHPSPSTPVLCPNS